MILGVLRGTLKLGTRGCLRCYGALSSRDIEFFKTNLGENGVLTEDLEFYNTDWRGVYHGDSKLVLRPRSTLEVSTILKYCNEKKLPVVPQGGNTSFVGASVPIRDEVILSLQRMDQIAHFEEHSGTVSVEAGAILQNIQEFAQERGFTTPHDLGSKASCTIGGNLGTDVGGLRIIRYGKLRNSVLGMKIVLADGTILGDMTTMRKDNTGYDVKQLFIGSEGTLGVITEASVLLPRAPRSVNVLLLACTTFTDIMAVVIAAKKELGEIVSACEYMDKTTMASVVENLPIQYPLDEMHPHYFILETSGHNGDHDREKLDNFVSKLFEQSMCADGVVATNEDQAKSIFSLRENAVVGIKALGGHHLAYDFSISMADVPAFLEKIKARLSDFEYVLGTFAHIGDNDMHVQIVTPTVNHALIETLQPFIFELVQGFGGSISAETGIGVQNLPFLQYSKKGPVIQAMKQLKKAFDPNNIMNPDKIFR